MSNLVIVAIPAADESVWKVSSEKVPHLTLLFLGPLEADDNTQRMADFIEHAVEVSEHGPFYLTVDYRDELGDDNADVLYFKDDRSLKWVNSFRNQLLQQNDIRAEFEEMEAAGQQFPEWVPHLTLGYPDAPAKPLPNDYPIYSVCFDRIALWTTDFDGPEFRLEWPERDESSYPALAYSDTGKSVVDKLLTRNTARKGLGLPVLEHAGAKSLADVHKAGADHANKHLPKINERFTKKYPIAAKNGTLLKDNHPLSNTYVSTVKNKLIEGLNKAADGTNVSDTRTIKIVSDKKDPITQFDWEPGKAEVKHAVDDADPTTDPLTYTATRDEHGMFIGLETLDEAQEEREEGEPYGPEKPDELEQSAVDRGKQFVHTSVLDNPTLAQQIKDKIKDILDDVDGDADGDVVLFGDPLIRAKLQSVLDDFYKNPNVDNVAVYSAMGEAFMHYGIKGMRWGRSTRGERSSSPEPVAPSATSHVPHGDKRKTKIETEGGQNHPAHADAIKVAEAQTKLKKSGLSALSNQELRDVATRVQLETQVSMLTGHKGKQFVKRQLGIQGQQTVQRGLAKGIATGAAKKGGKAALLFA
jgi:2'-5' RNA ligase